MRSTDAASRVVSSLPDLRNVPLTQIALPATAGTGAALARLMPDSPVAPVAVAAFNSAI
jgi:FXSXX-COOH protein